MNWLDTLAARRLSKKARDAQKAVRLTERQSVMAKVAQLRAEKGLPPIAGQRPHRMAL